MDPHNISENARLANATWLPLSRTTVETKRMMTPVVMRRKGHQEAENMSALYLSLSLLLLKFSNTKLEISSTIPFASPNIDGYPSDLASIKMDESRRVNPSQPPPLSAFLAQDHLLLIQKVAPSSPRPKDLLRLQLPMPRASLTSILLVYRTVLD